MDIQINTVNPARHIRLSVGESSSEQTNESLMCCALVATEIAESIQLKLKWMLLLAKDNDKGGLESW